MGSKQQVAAAPLAISSLMGRVMWLACAVCPAPALAADVPLIGYLSFLSPGNPFTCGKLLKSALAERGVLEGRDYRMQVAYANGTEPGLQEAARQLAAAKPALMVSGGVNPMLALARAAPNTPLVTVGSGSLLDLGLVRSHARPGGLLTGISNGGEEHVFKLIELLLQAFPGIEQVGIVANQHHPGHVLRQQLVHDRVKPRRVQARYVWVDGDKGVEAAYQRLAQQGIRHAVYLPDWLPNARVHAAVASKLGIATIGFAGSFADAGGLMHFTIVGGEGCSRAAHHVQQLLAGRRPGDVPVEEVQDYRLTVNLQAARRLGVTFAPAFLLRADRVIE
ncbi:ABC transporter substrate-binding protein [Aquabacterium sp. J223]|uniref:ABC transporter substrate-binding protein n=1 Tax=Aquabacterium sp. J223 TaxID=2898431 RepID=UPI0021AD5ACC|nr:ABC transporter substrate-binding protein [Aquabacterium sp. J223]UUX97173.1 ABC transporter substrate-binding protein [Aquabacterium sp. J223]